MRKTIVIISILFLGMGPAGLVFAAHSNSEPHILPPPTDVSATASNLQAIIQQLQEQIKALGARIAELQSQPTPPSPLIPPPPDGCLPDGLVRVRLGENNESVKNFQRCLIKLGYNVPAGATGYYGTQTTNAVKEFYRSVMNLGLPGTYIGPKGIKTIREFSAIGRFAVSDLSIQKVASADELRFYLDQSRDLSQTIQDQLSVLRGPIFQNFAEGPGGGAPPPAAPLAESATPAGRVSETTVQVKGIDEPDILKTDGTNIYFSHSFTDYIRPIPIMEMGASSIYPPPVEPKTSIVKVFPPEDLELKNKIDARGDLLLLRDKKILVILTPRELLGYDVSDVLNPIKKWSIEIEQRNNLISARLYNNKIYFVTRENISFTDPCPIRPLLQDGVPIIIECIDIFRPSRVIPVDSTFTAFILNPENGGIEKKLSFIGSNRDSVLYMSQNALYVTYFYSEDIIKLISKAIQESGANLFPATIIEKVKRLDSYDISQRAKQVELDEIFNEYYESLSSDERLRIENEWNNRLTKYLKTRKRELERTAIVKIGLDDFSISNVGNVPGYPLNQFALDEYNDYLRIAVTVGERSLWSFRGWWGGSRDSANDVYVLDNKLSIVGSVQDMGLTERIYSARFIGDKGYLVTFRQIDPFYVLDLSDPRNPVMKGELKIPGFSAYLEPLDENRILGVGREGGKVKVSLFDISDPANPTEKDKYILDEGWSEVLSNHHAFLLDDKHKVFFLPGSKGGYVFSYKDDTLSLVKAVSDFAVKRAAFLDDFLYIVSENKIVVFDELTWEKVNEIEL